MERTGKLGPLGGKPGHDIGDILWRHRLAWHVTTPIGSAEFRPAGNYSRAKTLIAHQSQIGAIHNGTGPPAAAVCAMTRRTEDSIHRRSALWITGTLRRIGRRIRIAQRVCL